MADFDDGKVEFGQSLEKADRPRHVSMNPATVAKDSADFPGNVKGTESGAAFLPSSSSDPQKLAELRHPRIQGSRAEIAKSLQGHWRQELIFVLEQEIEM